MKLIEALRADCIAVGLAAADKDAVLKRVAQLAKSQPSLENITEEDLIKALKNRESLGTTGFGRGIAIPHCRLDAISDFIVGLINIPDGVDFQSLDDQKVRLVVFIIGPDDRPTENIRLLSGISRILANREAVSEMLAADNKDSLMESFLRFGRDEIDTRRDGARSLIHVFIQNEEYFRQILEVFGSIENSYTVIMGAENTSAYLSKMPLFAGFWTDTPRTFCRVIIASVLKNMTNETIRQIESITGDLSESAGILVTIQELFFASGSLHP